LKILGLTILGIIAFAVIALFGIWLLLWIWPIVIIALPIALFIYLIQLYKIAKPAKKNRKK
jgi:membrane protein implicated in regulation of membrane protease activity